jgi:hypothetical protein
LQEDLNFVEILSCRRSPLVDGPPRQNYVGPRRG